jgi:hypothetical protein
MIVASWRIVRKSGPGFPLKTMRYSRERAFFSDVVPVHYQKMRHGKNGVDSMQMETAPVKRVYWTVS